MKLNRTTKLLLAAVGVLGITGGLLLGGFAVPKADEEPQALQITDATPISDAEVAEAHQAYLDLQVWADVLNTLAKSAPGRFHVYLESEPEHGCTKRHWTGAADSPGETPTDLEKIENIMACASRAASGANQQQVPPWHTTLQERSDRLWQAEDPIRLLQVQLSRSGYTATVETSPDLKALAVEYQPCRNTAAETAWLRQTPSTPDEETAVLWVELQDHYRKCAARRSEERFPAEHGFKKP